MQMGMGLEAAPVRAAKVMWKQGDCDDAEPTVYPDAEVCDDWITTVWVHRR